MAKAKRSEAWSHTSWLCALIANTSFGATKAKHPNDFNPMIERTPMAKMSPKETIDFLEVLERKPK